MAVLLIVVALVFDAITGFFTAIGGASGPVATLVGGTAGAAAGTKVGLVGGLLSAAGAVIAGIFTGGVGAAVVGVGGAGASTAAGVGTATAVTGIGAAIGAVLSFAGFVFSSITGIVATIVFAFWLWLIGVNYFESEKFAISAATFLTTQVPIINIIPAWTLFILITIFIVRTEDGNSNIMRGAAALLKKGALKNAIDPPKPKKRSNVDGIQPPEKEGRNLNLQPQL